ncbi:MAG: hypothetical protein H0X59_02900 [Chloroflexi bacterium]|nr:hypothetical protein [Chloroflexota bacterium]
MTQRQPPRPGAPGEVRGAPRGPAGSPAAGRRTDPAPLQRPPRILPATLAGLLVAAAVALVLGLLRAVFELGPGLLVVAAVGAWLLGEAVARVAWGAVPHLPRADVPRIAAVLGAMAWLAGSAVDYLVSLALLPGSSRTFGERLSDQPFPAWLAPQLSLLDAAEIVVLVVVAWRSAR